MYRRRKRTRVAPKARTKEEKCITSRCRNRKAIKWSHHRNAAGVLIKYENFLNHCWKCRSKMLKERRPVTYVLNAMRQRAKQRKIPFDITLEQFIDFCKRTDYIARRGRKADDLSIDRIDHDKGYHIWNIQVKAFLENCTIGHSVPGKETMQNERKPEAYDYDRTGPDPDYVAPEEANAPF